MIMAAQRLDVWRDAKGRAEALAQKSGHNEWTKDVRRVTTALLEEHPILATHKQLVSGMARDAVDLAYRKVHSDVPVDPEVIERKYAVLAEIFGAPAVPVSVAPTTGSDERRTANRTSILVWGTAAAAVLAFMVTVGMQISRRTDECSTACQSVQHETGGVSGEPEPDFDARSTQSVSPKPRLLPDIEGLAEAEGYFVKDGKIYFQVSDNDTIWNRLWRGSFKFYPTWDGMLSEIRRLNPDLDPNKISKKRPVVVAELNGQDYHDFLTRHVNGSI